MRKFLGSLVFACLAVVSVSAQNLPRPTGLVTDLANVLPPYVENSITQKIQAYRDLTGIELAVVTVSSLQGNDIDEYAVRLFNSWGVGQRGKDNGVMLLLAPREREVRIEVGYGLEGDLTDGQSGSILDRSAVPYFRDNDWAGGVNATVDALLLHLGQKGFQTRVAERVERNRVQAEDQRIQEVQRQQAEAESRRKQAEFGAAMGTFFSFAIPIGIVIAGAVLFYFHRKRAEQLRQLQRENDVVIKATILRFDTFNLRVDEAETVLAGLATKNIDSIRHNYSATLKSLQDFRQTCLVETIPGIWAVQMEYKRAQEAREIVASLSKAIDDAEIKADDIISLPSQIESKKKWAIAHRGNVIAGVLTANSEFESFRHRLNDDYRNKIAGLLKGLEGLNEKLGPMDASDDKTDWSCVSTLLNEARENASQAIELKDAYFRLVLRAKTEKPALISQIHTAKSAGTSTIEHSDVETSTVAKWRSAVAQTDVVCATNPKSEQDWVQFLETAEGLLENLQEINKMAVNDIERAEENRRRARRRAEEARQAQIRARQRSSSSSSSRSGGGFGGGRSGGGGASRKF